MSLNFKKEIKKLERKTISQLRKLFGEVLGEETKSFNRPFLIKKIAWRIQADAFGNLTERARKRANEIVSESDLRTRAPRGFITEPVSEMTLPDPNVDPRLPLPGTLLVRNYKGTQLKVKVLRNGFEFEGEFFLSLSAVAKAATGSHWNGFDFFKLRPAKKRKDRRSTQ